jgi:hypothetical protein
MDLIFKASDVGPTGRDEAHAHLQPIEERNHPFVFGFHAMEQLFDATKSVMRERGLVSDVMSDAAKGD